MSIVHFPLLVDDVEMGDLVALGRRVTLYTVRNELRSLDGQTFDSPRDAATAIRSILHSTTELSTVAA